MKTLKTINSYVRADRMNKQHFLLTDNMDDKIYVCTLCGKEVSLHDSHSVEGGNLICDDCYDSLGAEAAEKYMYEY